MDNSEGGFFGINTSARSMWDIQIKDFLTSACWVIFHAFAVVCSLFFKINFFQKILSVTLSECQTIWIQIRTDILSVLIWVQTVCKGYQPMTKVPASKERVKILHHVMSCEDTFSDTFAKGSISRLRHILEECFWFLFFLESKVSCLEK